MTDRKNSDYDRNRASGSNKSASPKTEKYNGPKHSGCTKGVDKKGKNYVRAWNYGKRRGMLTAYACEYKSSGEHTSEESGITYTNLMVKLNYKDSGVEKIVGGLLSHKTGKITIPELGMVMNPSAPNRGYFGTFSNDGD